MKNNDKIMINTILEFIENMFQGLIDFLDFLVDKKDNKLRADLGDARNVFHSKNKGYSLTGKEGKNGQISQHQSFENLLCIGNTGSGKTSRIIVPSLLLMKGNFIINDPAQEILKTTGGYLSQEGYNIKILKYESPEESCGFNPLDYVHDSTGFNKISSILVNNSLGGGKTDPFFNLSAENLLTIIIATVKAMPIEFQSMAQVRDILNSLSHSPEKVDILMAKYAPLEVFTAYKGFIAQNDRTASSIISTCLAATKLWADESVRKITSHNSIDFQELREGEKTALFIQCSVSSQKYFSVLTSLFFELLFDYIFSKEPNKEGDQVISCIIDEASSLYMPTLNTALANCRKWKFSIASFWQAQQQISSVYGMEQARSILSNSRTKAIFPSGIDIQTATELERVFGKFEYVSPEDNRRYTRSLFTANEIMQLPKKKLIVTYGEYAPFLLNTRPYFEQKHLRKLTELPFERNVHSKKIIVPLINLDSL